MKAALYMKLPKNADIIYFHVLNPMGELACCMSSCKRAGTLCTYHPESVRQKAFVYLGGRVIPAGLQTGEFYRAFFHVADVRRAGQAFSSIVKKRDL